MLNRITVFLLAFVLSFSVFAAGKTYSFDIQNERLSTVCVAVFKGVLNTDFFISPDVLADDRRISLVLTNKDEKQVLDYMQASLAASGLKAETRQGFYLITKIPVPSAAPGAIPGSASVPAASETPVPEKEQKPVEPVSFYTFNPKYRSSDELKPVLRFAGAVVADQKSIDSLVYSATDEQQKKIQPLLDQLDVKPQSVTIRAAVIEITNTADSSRSFSGLINLLTGKLNIKLAAGQTLANSISFNNTNLNAVLSATDGDSRFNYLAQPVLKVLNGNKANITVGSDVPTRGDSTVDKNGNINNSIQYQTAGLILDITPKIYGDMIELTVDQQVSSFSKNDTSNIDSPTKLKRRASSVLDVRRGELLVMAGLDEDKKTDTRGGFSLLPDFLRSKSSSSLKSQILLLIEVI